MTSPFKQLLDDPDFRVWMADLVEASVREQFRKLSEMPVETRSQPDPNPAVNPDQALPVEGAQQHDRLSELFAMVALIRNDTELQQRFLRQELAPDEDSQVEQLLTVASHWERIEILWDTLKTRILASESPLSTDEQRLLNFVLRCHNRLWVDHAASLILVSEGEQYNYEKHFSVGQATRLQHCCCQG
jgi:hypothetical protein